MPNWCDNQITITGPNSVIDKIEKIVKEESNNAEDGEESQKIDVSDEKTFPTI